AVFAEDTNLQFLIDSQTVVPAQACIEADDGAGEFYDDVVPSVTNAYTVQDVLWPAAFGGSMPIMYVNRDHLRAAGLAPGDPAGALRRLEHRRPGHPRRRAPRGAGPDRHAAQRLVPRDLADRRRPRDRRQRQRP